MVAEALKWITDLLQELEIPYLVCGGLAAIGYGSTRPLNDIDLFVPGQNFATVVSAASEYISKPAKHYQNYGWDLEYVQFIYQGSKVEVGNAEGARIFNASSGQWVPLPIDFSRATSMVLFEVDVLLMQAGDLISYKKILDRPVDREDIEAIEANTDD